jgi:hypothetical protein
MLTCTNVLLPFSFPVFLDTSVLLTNPSYIKIIKWSFTPIPPYTIQGSPPPTYSFYCVQLYIYLWCIMISAQVCISPRTPVCDYTVFLPQGAETLPPSSTVRVAKTGRNHLNEEFIYPSPPHWDRREILAKPYKFRACSALAPM